MINFLAIDGRISNYNATGSLLWTSTLNFSHHDAFIDVAVSSNGTSYVTGRTVAGNVEYAHLVAYDTSGTLLWNRNFSDPLHDGDSANAVLIETNGLVVSGRVGELTSLGRVNYPSISRFDFSGTLLSREYFWDEPKLNLGRLVQSSTGGEFFAAATEPDGTTPSGCAVRLNYTAVIWKECEGPASVFGLAKKESGIVTTGWAPSGSTITIETIRRTDSGDVSSRSAYTPSGSLLRNFGFAVAVNSEDEEFITGTRYATVTAPYPPSADGLLFFLTHAVGGNADAVHRKYGADGTVLWSTESDLLLNHVFMTDNELLADDVLVAVGAEVYINSVDMSKSYPAVAIYENA